MEDRRHTKSGQAVSLISVFKGLIAQNSISARGN